MNQSNTLLTELQTFFAQNADQEKAQWQQAYMKSTLPFWGITKPQVDAMAKIIIAKYAPLNSDEYCATILYLFDNAAHREEWYAAILYARHFKKYIKKENIPTYIKLIEKSQWWDIVDTVADHLIGKALFNDPVLSDFLLDWIESNNMWIRRSALLTQLKYKQLTNFDLLTQLIKKTAHEKKFFIAKAIGWALREYSKTNPEKVKKFIQENKLFLQPLSFRQGSKYI